MDLLPAQYLECNREINARYLPLIGSSPSCDPGKCLHNFRTYGIQTLCIAGYNKTFIPYRFSIFDIIFDILKETDASHIQIGRMPFIFILLFRIRLLVGGIRQKRFKHYQYIESVSSALTKLGASVYLCPFPLGAGKTLVEAMGCGLPVAVHIQTKARDRYIEQQSYEGAFKWNEPEELVSWINKLDEYQISSHSQRSRDFFEEYHQPSYRINDVLGNSYKFRMPEIVKAQKALAPRSTLLAKSIRLYFFLVQRLLSILIRRKWKRLLFN